MANCDHQRPYGSNPFFIALCIAAGLIDVCVILLLGRLRPALPLSARRSRCRRIVDPLGDHPLLVPRRRYSDVEESHSKKLPPECAAKPAPTTNRRLMEWNIDNVQRQDHRRIEVIANGLPLSGGIPLAIDTTLVSPFLRASEPRSRAGRYAVAAIQEAGRAKNARAPKSSKHDAANSSC